MAEAGFDPVEAWEPESYLAVCHETEPGYTEVGQTITHDIRTARNHLARGEPDAARERLEATLSKVESPEDDS